MRKLFGFLTLLLGAAVPASGQIEADLLRAQDAYEKSNVELAKSIFTQILNSRQQITADQRVTAYKYLGAYWALQSSPAAKDSANSFFVPALDFDPFTTLDQVKFAADEQAAFARAKMNIFRIGIRPIDPKALDPTSSDPAASQYVFKVVATHAARMTMEIASLDSAGKKETLPAMSNNGDVRDVVWNGLINLRPADPGLYEFKVTATDGVSGHNHQPAVEIQRFRVEHLHAPLEDTLPEFKDTRTGGVDTLKSEIPGTRPFVDGAKGLFIATVAGALPIVALSNRSDMSGWKSHLGIGISLGAIAGSGAAWYASKHPKDARAVLENVRRRNLRAKFNADVVARNRARLDRTILIIRPLTSAGIGG